MACATQNKDISPSAAARLVTRAWLPRPASEQQKAGAAAEGKTLTSIHGLLSGGTGDSVSRLPVERVLAQRQADLAVATPARDGSRL